MIKTLNCKATATVVQYTGRNLKEVMDYVFSSKRQRYSIIIEDTSKGRVLGIGNPSLPGACLPLAGAAIVNKGDWLVRWPDRCGLRVMSDGLFKIECEDRGYTS